ncbi:hypothetical protein ES702_05397 [subsurface metagenome]
MSRIGSTDCAKDFDEEMSCSSAGIGKRLMLNCECRLREATSEVMYSDQWFVGGRTSHDDLSHRLRLGRESSWMMCLVEVDFCYP